MKGIIINSVASSPLISIGTRRRIYKLMGMNLKTTSICPRCFFGGTNITMGAKTFVNFNNFFDLSNKITVGDKVHIGMGCYFITGSHEIASAEMRAGKNISAPIVIEDGCWIAAHVTILPGVTIKKGTIIAAGSVVTKDCEENSIYAGVPARKIRDLSV